MGLRHIFHLISNFLFSRANREFLIFLFFFALSGVFWLLTTLNETYEKEIRIPVRYSNVPKNVVLTSGETDTLRVVVSDKGIILVTYIYQHLREGVIDFSAYDQKNGTGRVPVADLKKLVAQLVPASSKVVAVKPDQLTFYYNYGEKKRVPVKWSGLVTPEDLHFISQVLYSPDSVTIFASREKLDSISVIYTDPLHYTGFRDTLHVVSRLRRVSGVKIVPEQVQIRFIPDVLTEGHIDDVPITGINIPAGKTLRTFPAKVRVNFVTGMKNYQMLSPSDFLIVADYNELKDKPSDKCNVYLRVTPEGVSRATLETKQVDYLIEESDQP